MALTKERKEELVSEYTDLLSRSKGLIFTEYRGMPNKELMKLRRAVRDANAAYHVTKLTLLKKAMEMQGLQVPEGLEGTPIGVTFCLDDVPTVAKALRDYAKGGDLFKIRGGVMGDLVMNVDQVQAIADLPSIDVLRSQILGLLDAPAASLVGVIQAGVSSVVNVLHAYTEGQGGAPASEAAAAE